MCKEDCNCKDNERELAEAMHEVISSIIDRKIINLKEDIIKLIDDKLNIREI